MPEIETYVFFDIETTGLPWQERNGTKIIEASFVAVHRKDIERANFGELPLASKYTFVLNPLRPIHSRVTELTGLCNQSLARAPLFIDKLNSLKTFIDKLPKPACLVAHNGNTFDFKILQAECADVRASLPIDLLCVDSLIGFRKLLKGTTIGYSNLRPVTSVTTELLTDDEEEDNWPDLNVSHEEWEEIGEICLSLSDKSCEHVNEEDSSDNEETRSNRDNRRDEVIKNVFRKDGVDKKVCNNNCSIGKESFTLSALYRRLLNKDALNAHRAEADCLMLLECVVALKSDFLPWAEDACKPLCEVKPLIRY